MTPRVMKTSTVKVSQETLNGLKRVRDTLKLRDLDEAISILLWRTR